MLEEPDGVEPDEVDEPDGVEPDGVDPDEAEPDEELVDEAEPDGVEPDFVEPVEVEPDGVLGTCCIPKEPSPAVISIDFFLFKKNKYAPKPRIAVPPSTIIYFVFMSYYFFY